MPDTPVRACASFAQALYRESTIDNRLSSYSKYSFFLLSASTSIEALQVFMWRSGVLLTALGVRCIYM